MTARVPCGIRNIDLDRPLGALVAEGDEKALLAVFWQDETPVGRCLLLHEELPVPATAMPALAASVCAAALANRKAKTVEAGGARASDVSVVICTRDRPDDLRRCLTALAACDPAPGEIIVVDNASDPRALAAEIANFHHVRLVHEPRAGLSHARNRGLSAAMGKIVAFTDDDVEVARRWVGCLAEAFADPSVGAVTGPVLPAQLQTEAAAAFEFDLGGLGSSLEPRVRDRRFLETGPLVAPALWELGAGANYSLRREVLEETGPFDVRLGAGTAGCSEDSEFLHRLLATRWTCRYSPDVVVHHHHRSTVEALRQQQRAYARGHVAALLFQFLESGHVGHLKRVMVDLPRHYFYWLTIRVAARAGLGWLDLWSPAARATRAPQMAGWAEGLVYAIRHARSPKYGRRAREPQQ